MKIRVIEKLLLLPGIIAAGMAWGACSDISSIENNLFSMEARVDSLENWVSRVNDNAIALAKLSFGSTVIIGMDETTTGYVLSLSDGTEVKVTYGLSAPGIIPIIGIDEEGKWIVSMDGGKTFKPIEGAAKVSDNTGKSPKVRINSEGYWEISLDGDVSWEVLTQNGVPVSAANGSAISGKTSVFSKVQYDEAAGSVSFSLVNGTNIVVPVLNTFYLRILGLPAKEKVYLGEEKNYRIEKSEVEEAIIRVPEGWTAILADDSFSVKAPISGKAGDYDISIIIVSSKGHIKNVNLLFELLATSPNVTGCKPWDDFAAGNADNVLLDFSYAGYNHGESAPPEVSSLGYTVYDVTDYGAVPNDGKSDRDAFIAAYQAAIGAGKVQNLSAKAVVYFPEGEFILHSSADNINGASSSIFLRAGDFVVRGAGRDKTTLVMQDPNLPAGAAMYSSPVMLAFKHYSGMTELTTVSSNSVKGGFSVEVASTAGISVGDWVCLFVANNSSSYISAELAPYALEAGMTNMSQSGVTVEDIHQVKCIEGKTLTFAEPIMHAVEASAGWQIYKYPHYENVGVEDLTFKGNAKADFVHHGSWEDDGAYKPISFHRITNGWLRRVRFTSVSEACSIITCANFSTYDVIIDGNRGHSAIRSQESSRVLIAKVDDHSSGHVNGTTTWREGTGQYHAVGVSKPAIGTVLWRNIWGNDSCFESHATQPRATLIDCCTGGWIQYRQGGDENQMPNHLGDLTIWNFESTTPWSGSWNWWSSGKWWKFLPPVIVGFHGEACSFDSGSTKMDYSHGSPVNPESLYEAQLRRRLGSVPAWLNAIK